MERTSRVCKKCKIEKALSEFYKDCNGKYGRMSRCKQCTNIQQAVFRAANPESIRKWRRNFYNKNLEVSRGQLQVRAANRRAREYTTEGKFTYKEWIAKCKSYDFLCANCKQKKPLTIDHVEPLFIGGANDISNIQPLCSICNRKKKSSMLPKDQDRVLIEIKSLRCEIRRLKEIIQDLGGEV